PPPDLGAPNAHGTSARRGSPAASVTSRIAIRIRRTVAPLQADLMRPVALRPIDEEFRIEPYSSCGIGVELHHPAVDTLWIELRIDRAIKRVGEINAPAVAADLDHLRSTIELAVLGT